MENYVHRVNYYETDKMGITHHSNYVRWMEEARIYFFEQMGLSYKYLEAEEVYSPVVGIECSYKSPTTFGDEVEIKAEIAEYNGVKLVMKYTMVKKDSNVTVSTGLSRHCFVDKNGKLIFMKKAFPEFDAKMKSLSVGKDN
ncbi:MAG: acyl-CoA thioesterase [Christensenellales bacterium]